MLKSAEKAVRKFHPKGKGMFSLHVTNVSKQDVVKYICSAYFADGDSDGLLKLYESVKFFFFFQRLP